jgi:antitoxin (DNA-binding transcriptional repressor) of toxin-antitoxin stability system
VKTISIEEAQGHFQAVCEAVLAGEVIRLQTPGGAVLELRPVQDDATAALPDEVLAKCYEDSDWAAFENHCAAASD